ncbi:MAG: hypothetical protein EOR86_23560 [Mesorhizobium sp.]|nr:MAG: hypothetical protein EOR86_23560 [Mesorhizobium sp.]
MPNISPTRGEIGSSSASLAASVIGESRREYPISPLVGEMSGRTEGGATDPCPAQPTSAQPGVQRDFDGAERL